MDARFAKRHSMLCGVLLAIVAIHVGCEKNRTPANEVKAYHYTIPEKTNDGWETASLSSENIDAELIKELFERIVQIDIISKSRLIHPHAIFFAPHSQTQLHALLCAVDLMMTMPDFDLALLRTPKHVRLPEGYPCVEIEDYESIWDGDEVATCGFPLGNFLYDQIGTVTSSFTRGIVSSIIPAHGVALELVRGFQLDLTATHGNSGGPVFRIASQRVFGVLQSGVRDRQGNTLPGIVKAEPVYPVLTPTELTLFKNAPPGQLPQFPKK